MIYIVQNLLPILLATAAGLGIALAVYPPLRSAGAAAAALAATFWFASILAGALILAPPKGSPWVMAIGTAIVIWAGFVAPALVVTLRGRGVTAAQVARDAGCWLAVMIVEAAILHTVGLMAPAA